jgi:hypothetical protein
MLANGTSEASLTARTASRLSAVNSESKRSWRARKIEPTRRTPVPRALKRLAALVSAFGYVADLHCSA